nr:hypothetical protein Iba_chr10dCG14200 [Ipomoea batatas]
MALYYVPSSYSLVLYPPSYQSSSYRPPSPSPSPSPSLPPPPVVRRRIQRMPASSSPSPSPPPPPPPPPSPATHYGVAQVLHSEKVKVLLQKALQKFSKLLALSSKYEKEKDDTPQEKEKKNERDETPQEKEKDDTSEKEKKKK